MQNTHKFFISAPFGNYLKFQNAISVTGSWTIEPRPGLIPQVLKTLRYVRVDKVWGWRNKIGLRNAGIHKGLTRMTNSFDVMSIASIQKYDWINFDSILPEHQNIEVNISCPNLDKDEDATQFPHFDRLNNGKRQWCICKVPPTITEYKLDQIIQEYGYTQIHASNTLYSDKGGLSGKRLATHTLRILDIIKTKYPHITVIAGGGVTEKYHSDIYKQRGADHISLGTVCFTPWKVKGIIHDA